MADRKSAVEMLTVGFNSMTVGFTQYSYAAKLILGFLFIKSDE